MTTVRVKAIMKAALSLLIVIGLLPVASAQEHVVYAEPAGPLHMLDVYAMPKAKNAPAIFWIHGGGWETGDKSDVAQKPQFFVEPRFCVRLDKLPAAAESGDD